MMGIESLSPSLRAYMTELGIDALICGFPPNVRYVTGYYNWLDALSLEYMGRPGGGIDPQMVFSVVTREGLRGLAVQTVFLPNVGCADIDFVAPYGDFHTGSTPIGRRLSSDRTTVLDVAPSSAAALARLLDAVGGTPAEVGVDVRFLSAGQQRAIRDAIGGARLRDATATLLLARARKSCREVEHLRTAAQIAEEAMSATLANAAPRIPIAEIRREFRTAIGRHDADYDHLAFGVNGNGIAMEVDYRLEPGSTLYVDFGCVYQGYFSDSGLTVNVGAEAGPAAEAHEAARSVIEAGEAALEAGRRSSSVRAAMQDAVASRGFGSAFPHGHGLGLQLRDYPILVEDTGLLIEDDYVSESSDLELTAGNVVNLEVGIFDHRWGSVQIEKSYVIDPSTGVVSGLVDQPRDHPVRV